MNATEIGSAGIDAITHRYSVILLPHMLVTPNDQTISISYTQTRQCLANHATESGHYLDTRNRGDVEVVGHSSPAQGTHPSMAHLRNVSLDEPACVKEITRHQRGPRSSITMSEAILPGRMRRAISSSSASSSGVSGRWSGMWSMMPLRYR